MWSWETRIQLPTRAVVCHEMLEWLTTDDDDDDDAEGGGDKLATRQRI